MPKLDPLKPQAQQPTPPQPKFGTRPTGPNNKAGAKRGGAPPPPPQQQEGGRASEQQLAQAFLAYGEPPQQGQGGGGGGGAAAVKAQGQPPLRQLSELEQMELQHEADLKRVEEIRAQLARAVA